MVTALFIIIVLKLLIIFVVIVLHIFSVVRVVIVRLQSLHVVTRLPLISKAGLAHLVLSASEIIFSITFIVENFFFFSFLLLVFELVNDLLLLLASLGVLQVVHV